MESEATESDLDIELTDDEIGIIKLSLFSFVGLISDVIRTEGEAKLKEVMKDSMHEMQLGEEADLIALGLNALKKFDYDAEEGDTTEALFLDDPDEIPF